MITRKNIIDIMPLAGGRAILILPRLNSAMQEYSITTKARAAAFLAQIAHESGQLRWMHEIWGPTPSQKRYERDFTADWPPSPSDPRNKLAWTLGNSEPGDGARFKGRGLIHTTGRANYRAASVSLFGDERLLKDPEELENMESACRSAGEFWRAHGLNPLADAGQFEKITRTINGGLNGHQERCEFHARALKALEE